MTKITLKNISEFCILSMDDEKQLQRRLECSDDADILQAMVNYLTGFDGDSACMCSCDSCSGCIEGCL